MGNDQNFATLTLYCIIINLFCCPLVPCFDCWTYSAQEQVEAANKAVVTARANYHMLCVERAQVEKTMGITPRHQTSNSAESIPKAPLEGANSSNTRKIEDLPTGEAQPKPLIIPQTPSSTEIAIEEAETQPPQPPSNTQ